MDEIVVQAMAKWPNVPAAWGWLRLDRRGHWRLIDRNAPGFDEATHGGGTRLEHAAFADAICRNYHPDEQGRWFFQNGPQRVFVDLELAPLVLRAFDAKRRGGADAPADAGADRADAADAPADARNPQGDAADANAARMLTDATHGGNAGNAGVALVAHTGYPVSQVRDGVIDAHGNVFLDTDLGPGVVHDADLAALSLEEVDGGDGAMRLRLRLATGDVTLRRTDQDVAERFGFVRRPRP